MSVFDGGFELAVLGGWPVAVVVALITSVLVFRALRTTPRPSPAITALRVATLLVACIVVIQPTWSSERVERTPGELAIIVDASRSMSVRANGRTRYDRAKALLERWSGERRAASAAVYTLDVALRPTSVDGIESGTIRGLWIIATNPAHSWIDQQRFNGLLDELDLLVVQDLYSDTETARRSDLFLPAAGWGEKDGTFINSERRVGRVRAASEPPGQARPDFEIFKGLAEEWGCGPMFRRWRSPAAVFDLLAELSRGRPCDLTGMGGHAGLGDQGMQWPWSSADAAAAPEGPEVERRLFGDGRFFTPDGRARFVFDPPVPPHDPVDEDLPLVLITGRGSTAQWHTGTRTGRSATLESLAPARLHLEMSPSDAESRRLRSGQAVKVRSRRSTVTATVFITPTVSVGQVFLAMHDSRVNALTAPGFDPYSRQPAYKHTAVQVAAAGRPE